MGAAMRTTIWLVGLVLVVGCQRNRARDCAPYAHDPVLDVCVCPEGTQLADGGVDCVEYDGGVVLSCPGGAPAVTVYADADGDGHGNPETERTGCPGEAGTSMLGDDCDDACASCRPSGSEVCDGKDNDCAGGADDTFACVQGTTSACTTTCGTAGTGACSAECTMPAACTPPSELCNESDDDCDELVDEGVLEAGPPSSLSGASGRMSVVGLDDGFVILFANESPAGLWAQRYSASAEAVGSAAMIAARQIDSVDAVLISSDEIGYAMEDADTIVVGSIDPRDLTPIVAPRVVGSRAGLWGLQIDEASPWTVLTYASGGGAIHARALVSLATDAGSEQTLVASRSGYDLEFDVIARFGSLGRTYVVYQDRLAGEADSELFLLVAAEGRPLDVPYRVTTNGTRDTAPSLATNDSGLIALTWLETPDESTVFGEVRLATLTHETGGWTETSRSSAVIGGGTSLIGREISVLADRRGWIVTHNPAFGTTGIEQRVRYVSTALRPIGDPIVPQPGADGTIDMSFGMFRTGGRAWVVSGRANSALDVGEVRAFPLGCE